MQYRADTATNAHAFAYALTLCASLMDNFLAVRVYY
jgi:hypothetical protein